MGDNISKACDSHGVLSVLLLRRLLLSNLVVDGLTSDMG